MATRPCFQSVGLDRLLCTEHIITDLYRKILIHDAVFCKIDLLSLPAAFLKNSRIYIDQSFEICEDGQSLSDDVWLNQVDALMRLLRFRNQSKQNMPFSRDAGWIRHLFSWIFWQWSKRLYFLGKSIDTFENRQHCNMFCLMARLSVGGARPLWPACRWGGLSGEFWTFQTPKSKVTNSGMYSKWIHLIVPGSVESAVSGAFYFMFEHY